MRRLMLPCALLLLAACRHADAGACSVYDLEELADITTPTADILDTPAQCFDVIGTDGHACVLCVNGETVAGRPVSELLLTESDCSDAQGWEWIGETPDGECVGVFAGVAIRQTR